MKFREWLAGIEENQRNRGTVGNMDMSRGLGPTSQYGHSAMMPISWGIDNRAAAGIIDGIGDARAKIRARKGAEPGVASQYRSWDEIRRDGITAIYMPLQLPSEYHEREMSPISSSKGLVTRLKLGGDPLKHDGVWKVGPDNTTLMDQPHGRNANHLYSFEEGSQTNQRELSDAKEYTTALMLASLAIRLEKYAHYLNIDKPRIKDQKIEYFPLGVEERTKKKMMYGVMMCAFILTSKHKGQEIDSEMRDEIERVLSGEKADAEPKKDTIQDGIKKGIETMSGDQSRQAVGKVNNGGKP